MHWNQCNVIFWGCLQMNWSNLFSAVAAVAALFTVIFAWRGTRYAMQTWRTQSEPKVIVYVKHDRERPSILLIVIENIGRDIAHHVVFTPSRPLPANAWGLPGKPTPPAAIMDSGPIVNGIPALGPGDSRVISWGQFDGLTKAIGDDPITLDYTYNTRERTVHERSRLEVASYMGTDASESAAAQSANSLSKIAASVESISCATKGIRATLDESATARADAEKRPRWRNAHTGSRINRKGFG